MSPSVLSLATLLVPSAAFVLPIAPAHHTVKIQSGITMTASAESMNRRAVIGGLAAAAFGVATSANADEQAFTGKMGGALEPYSDISKGFRMYKPYGWNQFDTMPGEYDVKFCDLVDSYENVLVASSNVKTATSIDALGDLETAGEKLAKTRNAKILASSQKTVDGILFYVYEMQNENSHEILSVSVNKGKLWRVTAASKNAKFDKRKEMYTNIVASFVPRL